MLTESTVRRLAALQGAPAVVSLYLDVDGRRYPRPSDYAPHLDHLLRTARDLAEAEGEAVAIEPDLERITEWLAKGLDRSSAKGVALFSATAAGHFDAFTLPVPVRDQVAVAPTADVAQLVGVLLRTPAILVVAADHQTSRLLRVAGAGGVEEMQAPADELERQVDTDVELGSFEHRHEEHVREHLRRVSRAAADELRHNGGAHLVLSGAHDVTVQLESSLPKDAAVAVAGTMNLPISSTPAELGAAARDVVEAARRGQQRALVEELADRAAQGALNQTGLPATLEALSAGQVDTLVVDAGFAAPGGRCSNCGALAVEVGPCPTCGAAVDPVTNVVDAAVTEAFVHHVTLALCDEVDLDRIGHIGALTRWAGRPAEGGG